MPIALAPRRDAPVVCPGCGRSTARRSRQQRFCSHRCRNNARGRVKADDLGTPSLDYTDPHKSERNINSLQASKQPPSLPINLLGSGWQWPGARERLDAETIEKIRRAEVAEPTELPLQTGRAA